MKVPPSELNFSSFVQKTNEANSDSRSISELAQELSHYSEKRNIETSNGDKSRRAKSEKQTYHLGPRKGNSRIIREDSVRMTEIRNGRNPQITISDGKLTVSSVSNNPNFLTSSADGYIGDSCQDRRGDCYFLASLNAIRNTKGGQALLKKNCRKNKDGSYTVTLPGANKIRKEYDKNGKPCEVTGTYKITPEALEKAAKSRNYSSGDIEVVAYELAMEAYRAEMYLTNKQNGQLGNSSSLTAEGQVGFEGFGRNGDILSSGNGWDAGFLLTGQKSEVYSSNVKAEISKPYVDGQYGYITREEMANRTGADISMYRMSASAKGVSEVSSFTKDERAINDMLNKYEGKEGEYSLTFDVVVGKNGSDGKTIRDGAHELTVVKITKDTVYVSNPWHPDKIEPIPRKDFIKEATCIMAMPVKYPRIPFSSILNSLHKMENKLFSGKKFN